MKVKVESKDRVVCKYWSKCNGANCRYLKKLRPDNEICPIRKAICAPAFLPQDKK